MAEGPFGGFRPFNIGPLVQTRNEHIGIWHLPESDLDRLERNIMDVWEVCSRSRDLPDFAYEAHDGPGEPALARLDELVELNRILIFGSYGRGWAVKGESDLDIIIDYHFHGERAKTFVRGELEQCMVTRPDSVLDGLREWFDGVDVIPAPHDEIEEYLTQAFRYPPTVGDHQFSAYDLSARETVTL